MPPLLPSTFVLRMGALVVILAVLAPWFHELAHWSVARFQTDAVELLYFLHVIPYSVQFGDIERLSNRGLALTALSPQLILLPFVVLYSHVFGIPTAAEWIYGGAILSLFEWGVFFAALAGGLVISPADLLAIFCQEKFRNWDARCQDERGHVGHARLLVRCILSDK